MRAPFSFFKFFPTHRNSLESSRTVTNPREDSKHSAHYILVSKWLGRKQQGHALDRTMFYSYREETEQDKLPQWISVTHGQRVSPVSWCRRWTHVHPLMPLRMGSIPILSENRHSTGVSQVLYDTNSSRTKVCILIGLKAEKDIPTQNDKLGIGYVSSFFWHETSWPRAIL